MHSNSISHPFPHSHTEWLTIAIALVYFKNAYFLCLKKVPSGIQTSSAFNIRNWSSHCLAFAKILKIFANICRPSRQPRFPSSSCTTSISTSRQTSASTMFWQGQAFWWEGHFKAPLLCPSVRHDSQSLTGIIQVENKSICWGSLSLIAKRVLSEGRT